MNSRMTLTIGGLLLIAATLGGCGGGSYSPSAPTALPTSTPTAGGAPADVTITIVGMNGSLSYSPNPATVKVGQTVAWRNADSVTHTATGDAGGFNTGNIAPGATSSPITMATAGSFAYHCVVHPSMTGTLTVTP